MKGDFEAGDAITCTDLHGKEFAKGLTNCSSETLKRIKGLKSAEAKQVIGQQEYEEVIHRDNLVIL